MKFIKTPVKGMPEQMPEDMVVREYVMRQIKDAYRLYGFNLIETPVVEHIENTTVWIYGIMTFVISLLPYFTIWLANNIYSIPAEIMFGLIFIITHILTTLANHTIYKSNPYNKELKTLNNDSYLLNTPIIVLIIGFILTYTVYRPGIYLCCLLSIVMWIILGRVVRRNENGN